MKRVHQGHIADTSILNREQRFREAVWPLTAERGTPLQPLTGQRPNVSGGQGVSLSIKDARIKQWYVSMLSITPLAK